MNIKECKALIEQKDHRELKRILSEQHEADIATLLEDISIEEVVIVFRMLPKELAAEVFAYLSPENQRHIISGITDSEIGYIIENLFIDDAVDFIEEMPASVVKRVLRNTKDDTRTLINQFMGYPENSAGSIMTSEYIGLKKQITTAQAFDYIRKEAIDKETIYTCYVTDQNRILEGIVTVKSLIIAEAGILVQDIMDDNVISVKASDNVEDVADKFRKYDLLALPVVDNEYRLLGIITVDDVVDLIEEEATEDFEKMAAMRPSEKEYLKTSILELAKNRIVWLMVLMFSSMITGTILASYESAFAIVPLLVSFIPMLMDTGGNSGSQSATMVIRGLAVNQVRTKDALKIFWKEFRVSLIVGLGLGVLNFIRIVIQYQGNIGVALTVSISVCFTVIMAKSIGGLLPLGAKALKLDPALMASPLITTIVDALSLMVYFTLATQILKI